MISINQVGYHPTAPKYAVASGDLADQEFNIICEFSGETLFSGRFESPIHDEATDTDVCTGCFTALTAPGTYHIEAGKDTSYSFSVCDRVYDDIYTDVFRMLYLQRCGVELPTELAGDFAHPSCHDTPARLWQTDRFKSVNGGWHDAGDYGRYVVPGAKVIADMLLLWRLFGSKEQVASEAMRLPESGNGIPDLLNEARFELDWFLRMQDEETGGVYHKVTCRTFPPFVMPQEEKEELVIAPISDAATADFCAVMYMAAVDYEPFDPSYAQICRRAADRAWAYLMSLDQLTPYANPQDLRTGPYGDGHVEDEVFFAATELLRWQQVHGMTPDEQALKIVEQSLAEKPYPALGWGDVNGYGLFECAWTLKRSEAKELLFEGAEKILDAQSRDGYGSSLGKFYPWGSTMVVANHGMLLLLCDALAPDPALRNGASRLLDHLLGVNGLNFCFVSGHGTDMLRHPHHRPSGWLGKAMPGMLSGGPNMHTQDAVARETVGGRAPALCYVDHTKSYSTNEIAIYWNSPLIFLLGALC